MVDLLKDNWPSELFRWRYIFLATILKVLVRSGAWERHTDRFMIIWTVSEVESFRDLLWLHWLERDRYVLLGDRFKRSLKERRVEVLKFYCHLKQVVVLRWRASDRCLLEMSWKWLFGAPLRWLWMGFPRNIDFWHCAFGGGLKGYSEQWV